MPGSTEWTHDHIWSILISVIGGKKKNEAVSDDVRRLVLIDVANEGGNQFCACADVVRSCEPNHHPSKKKLQESTNKRALSCV